MPRSPAAVPAAGFKDAYRTLHPDEIVKPGYTWTPWPYENELHDRIDFLYFKGEGVRPRAVRIIGEKDGPGVDIVGNHPYPSDHRGVLGVFEL